MGRPRSTATTSAARSGRPRCHRCPIGRAARCPIRRTSSSIGGGYAGINAARELATRGRGGRRSSRRTRSAGARRRATAGSSMPATSGARPRSSSSTARRPARALYQETLESYELVKRLIADEAIDCDFREHGHLELAYGASHVAELEEARESLASVGVAARIVPRERIREEIGSDAYYGGLAVPDSGLLHPGRYFAGLAGGRRPGRRRPPRGRPGDSDPPAGRRAVRGRDRPRRDPGPRRLRRHERLHGRRRAHRSAAGSSRSGATSSRASHSPRTWHASSRPTGRSFFDTKNFLYYWHVSADRRMIFGGPREFMPTTIDRTAAILHKGLLEVHPQLAPLPDRVRLGRQRRLHLRPDAAHRAAQGRRHVRRRLLRHRRALMTYLGTKAGEWLAGGEAPALSSLRSRSCPRRTRAGPGSCRSPGSGSASRTGSPPDPSPSPWRRLTNGNDRAQAPRGPALHVPRHDEARPARAGPRPPTLAAIAEIGFLGVETVDVPGGDPVAARRAIRGLPGCRWPARTAWTKLDRPRGVRPGVGRDRGARLVADHPVRLPGSTSTEVVDALRRPAERRGRRRRRATAWRLAITTTARRCARSTASRSTDACSNGSIRRSSSRSTSSGSGSAGRSGGP